MKKVLIIHGFKGEPNGGWRPWLMSELAKIDVWACALPMPTPSKPKHTEWVEEIARQVVASKKDEVYLVGHSLGVPAILRFLENTTSKNIAGAVLVSGPLFKTTKKEVADFLNKPFDFKKIRNSCKTFEVIHGTNDRAVSFNQGEALANELKCTLAAIENGGHLNGSAGFKTLPECLASLEKMFV